MPERAFFLLMLAIAVAAACCGLLVRIPRAVPDYALQAAPVYRTEVALAMFGTGYLIVVCLRLAWHGRTFTRVGSSLEVPEVHRRLEDEVTGLSSVVAELLARRGGRPPSSRMRPHLFAVDDPDDLA